MGETRLLDGEGCVVRNAVHAGGGAMGEKLCRVGC